MGVAGGGAGAALVGVSGGTTAAGLTVVGWGIALVGVGELVGMRVGKRSLCRMNVKTVGVAEGVGVAVRVRVAVGLGVGGMRVTVGESGWVGVTATMGVGGVAVSAGAQPDKISTKRQLKPTTRGNIRNIALVRNTP